MNRSHRCNSHRSSPFPPPSQYSPKRRSQESRQAHPQNHHRRRRGAVTASRSLPPRAHSCRPLSMRTRSSRARRISAAWSSIPVRAAAHVSDSSSTSIVNRIELSSTRIGLIDTIMRCADQNTFTLMHCSQQQSWITPSFDPTAASFRSHFLAEQAIPMLSRRSSGNVDGLARFRIVVLLVTQVHGEHRESRERSRHRQ